MSSIVERLIESWLDSQSERRYQPAFIQLLISEGWNVLHNTRHSPIEFGKDVIARNPDGLLHCFQLKGNPASRLTKTQAQGILDQVRELVEVPLTAIIKIKAGEKYKAVLVTNGEVDEEARLLLKAVGDRAGMPTAAASEFEIWSRGTLIDRFNKSAGKIWPTSVDGVRAVLDVIAGNGTALPDLGKISTVLIETAPPPKGKVPSSEKTARLAAVLLITEIIKSAWYKYENHYALYQITVIACVHALQFCDSLARLNSVQRYATLALDHCQSLMREAADRHYDPDKIWTEQDILAELDIQWERRRLVGDCAASLVLSSMPSDQYDADYAGRILEATFSKPMLWGYGAVPSLIQKYWALCKIRAGSNMDYRLGYAVISMLRATRSELAKAAPPGPYYSFEDVWAYMTNLSNFANQSIFDDSFHNRAWFAVAILYMLAKRNFKQTCKAIWNPFAQVAHEEPDMPNEVFFTVEHARGGKMKTRTFHGMHWKALVKEAVEIKEGEFLAPFGDLAWLIAAYIAIVPYRAWTGVIMWLDGRLGYSWYTKDYLPE